jgi:hypothetical protein
LQKVLKKRGLQLRTEYRTNRTEEGQVKKSAVLRSNITAREERNNIIYNGINSEDETLRVPFFNSFIFLVEEGIHPTH